MIFVSFFLALAGATIVHVLLADWMRWGLRDWRRLASGFFFGYLVGYFFLLR